MCIYIYIYIYLPNICFPFPPAGALGTMCSYNDYDGEPIAASHKFLTEYLRDKWGFRGVGMSCFAEDIIHHFYYLFLLCTSIALSLFGQGMW
jgi:beta-glucosidase